jgi:hypothetical protein
LETSLKRAKSRTDISGRKVDAEFIRKVSEVNLENAKFLQAKVDFFKQVENDGALDDKAILKIFKSVQGFFSEPLKNPVGKRYLKQMREEAEKYLSPNIIPLEVLVKKADGWYK